MTGRVGCAFGSPAFGKCDTGAGALSEGCGAAFRGSAALNGIAVQGPNGTRESHGSAHGSPARRARSPWASIVAAAVAVALVLGAELWAARRLPVADGTVASEVATEVSAMLADVATSPVMIGPSE
jgi:hypothetical protein